MAMLAMMKVGLALTLPRGGKVAVGDFSFGGNFFSFFLSKEKRERKKDEQKICDET
jgi:hypothetical protein